MCNIVILGAGSFIAKALVLEINNYLPIKAVTHKIPKNKHEYKNLVTWYEVNILEPKSLDNIISSGDIVINFIHLWKDSKQKNLLVIKNIMDTCQQKKISRLLHCSTIGVEKIYSEGYIQKITKNFSESSYEYIKYEIEEYINRYPLKVFEYALIRPSSIIGPQVKKYIISLLIARASKPFLSYLRASLQSKIPVHYVSCEKVANFFKYMINARLPLNCNTYSISSESDSLNNFANLENFIFKLYNFKARKIPLIPIPKIFLPLIYFPLGKLSNLRTYDSKFSDSIDFSFNENLESSIKKLLQNKKTKKYFDKNSK